VGWGSGEEAERGSRTERGREIERVRIVEEVMKDGRQEGRTEKNRRRSEL